MQFKALTVLALSALAMAAPELEKRQTISENPTEVSVIGVLATALPPSLLSIGVTNPAALGSIIASSFAAGQTPGWYSALPSDVKSYLTILYSEVASTAMVSTSLAPLTTTPLASIPSVQASISASISSSLNTTTIASVHSPSLKATTTTPANSAAGSASSAGASSTHTGGASYPSAVVGAGVAGALGLLGMLAL